MKKLITICILLLTTAAFSARTENDQHADRSGLVKTAKISTVPYVAGANKTTDFVPTGKVDVDFFSTTHSRYRQTYKGLRVFGADIIEHSRDGKTTITGRMAVTRNINTRASFSEAVALQSVTDRYGTNPFSSELLILPLETGAHLAYLFTEQAFDSRWMVFVDANTGKVLNAFNNMQHGTGTGVLGDSKSIDSTFNGSSYDLIASDSSRQTNDAKNRKQLPGTMFNDDDDVWTDGAAVDAHHYAGLVLDYYMEQFGRNSYDDAGALVLSTVHYDRNYVNAFWNGSQMVYGDGDGVNSVALSGGFDVVAHEITHAVTEHTSGLIYQNESGALNEGFSDIMGAAAEYYKQNAIFDWKMGEDIWTPGIPGDALRYMDDPTADGSSSDHYDDRYTGTSDNGGVHWNSGIANLAFVLACQGGSHPTYGGSYTGVGFDAATQIFYTAFTSYLGSSSNFSDARAACVLVATENYDAATAAEIDAVWVAVGAPDGGGTSEPEVTVVAPGVTFESNHPYLANQNVTWEVTSPGSTSMTVDFDSIDMENGYDFIYVKDGNDTVVATYTNKYMNGVSVVVNGDTARVNMVTDPLVNKQGFSASVTGN